jgi:hypothetical protein
LTLTAIAALFREGNGSADTSSAFLDDKYNVCENLVLIEDDAVHQIMDLLPSSAATSW